MKYRILSKTDKEQFGADVMAIVDYTDVTPAGATTAGTALSVAPATTSGALPAAGTSGTDTLPIGTAVSLVAMIVDTAFTGGAISAMVVKVGDGNSTNRFLANTSCFTTTNAVGTIANQPFVYTTADTVDAIFTSTTANLNALTAGSLRLFFRLDDQSQLPRT